jgi:hypothetical protein
MVNRDLAVSYVFRASTSIPFIDINKSIIVVCSSIRLQHSQSRTVNRDVKNNPSADIEQSLASGYQP